LPHPEGPDNPQVLPFFHFEVRAGEGVRFDFIGVEDVLQAVETE
jgi:hypothetical protein